MPIIRGAPPHNVQVVFEGNVDELDRLKASNIPNSRYNKTSNGWTVRASYLNLQRVVKAWPNAVWDKEAGNMMASAESSHQRRIDLLTSKDVDFSELDGFPFKDPQPWDHQKTALLLGRDADAFAYLMDQGTGKTRVVLDDAAHNYMNGRIEALLVLCPNSVKTNWVAWGEVDATDRHLTIIVPREKAVWISNSNAAEKKLWSQFEDRISDVHRPKSLIVLSVNYDAIHLKRVNDFLTEFVKTFKTMIVADESTKIKKQSSRRTKAAIALRKWCPLARIMTGTPIIKRPEDAYAQFMFLDPDILGFNSYYAFRNRYCLMGGWEGKEVVAYQRLDELSDKIASSSYRVMKDDCLDLPPKVYLPTRYVTMSKEQAKAYKTMQKDMYAEHEQGIVEARIVLTQQMRLQEITGGYLPIIDPDTGTRTGTQELVSPVRNPKFVEALELVEANTGQFIIWSCFRAEINGLAELLRSKGHRIQIFDGRTPDRVKLAIRKEFERGEWDGIVANAAAGGMGVDEFKVANLSIYISNRAGNTEERVQSEDRTHRGGMGASISYCDVLVHNSVDTKIRRLIDSDISLSQSIMKDGLKGVL